MATYVYDPRAGVEQKQANPQSLLSPQPAWSMSSQFIKKAALKLR